MANLKSVAPVLLEQIFRVGFKNLTWQWSSSRKPSFIIWYEHRLGISIQVSLNVQSTNIGHLSLLLLGGESTQLFKIIKKLKQISPIWSTVSKMKLCCNVTEFIIRILKDVKWNSMNVKLIRRGEHEVDHKWRASCFLFVWISYVIKNSVSHSILERSLHFPNFIIPKSLKNEGPSENFFLKYVVPFAMDGKIQLGRNIF
jgi:hypothetical protein